MNIFNMKKNDFKIVPKRKGFMSDEPLFDEIVIIPEITKHESGYRNMTFIGCIDGKAVVNLSGHSDVLHLDGIGGYGFNWLNKYNDIPKSKPVKAFRFDCLPCGYLRMWCPGHRFKVGASFSDFEIFAIKDDDNE